jgi:hypothetical protein
MTEVIGTISGRVTDAATGQGIPNCPVSARAGVTAMAVETDQRGTYRITNLPLGSYTVDAATWGYSSQSTADVSVQIGRTVTCDFKLQPKPPGGGS